MPTLLERCAYAFARDLPDGAPLLTAELLALVDGWREDPARTYAQLEDDLAAASPDVLNQLNLDFSAAYQLDWARCASEPARIGQSDHFVFEDAVRRQEVILALETEDDQALTRFWTASTGTRSPFCRAECSTASAVQWPILEALAEAVLQRNPERLVAARALRRAVSSRLRPYAKDLVKATRVVARRLSDIPVAPATPATPAAIASLEARVLGGLTSVTSLLVRIAGPVVGDTLVARPATAEHAVVTLVDGQHGGFAASAPVTSAECMVWLRVFSALPEVEVVISLRQAGVDVVTTTVRVPASPMDAVTLVGAAPPAPAALARPAPPPLDVVAPPASAIITPVAAPADRAAALTPDPALRRALTFFFTRGAISDTDLAQLADTMLVFRWSAEIPALARAGGFMYVMEVGPGGKVYRMG